MPAPLTTVSIGLLGCGTVGSGVVATLWENAEALEKQLGARLEIRRICVRDPAKPRGVDIPRALLTTNPSDVLDDPEIRIVAELIGGMEPARDYLLRALRAGKHVVTANKELIAKDGPRLLAEAARLRRDCYFEGAVAGGIPIIRALQLSLAANRIDEIAGIVNGTTNYILTRMSREGLGFEAALAEAQSRGYAEADPTDDVDGFDAAYKLAILAAIGFRCRVPLERVYHEGIRSVTDRDILYGRELGYVIKLLAVAHRRAGGIELRVHPAMVRESHPLAAVNDVFNAVYVRGSSVGEVMFYGRGAGSLPTGSSVAADILEAARGALRGGSGRSATVIEDSLPVLDIGEVVTNYYVRTETHDRPGVIAAIGTVFGNHGVSLESVLQKSGDGESAEIVWITHATKEGAMRAALTEIAALSVVRRVSNWIRVEE